MENHTFSEATAFPEGSVQPCWKVMVYRRGVDEAVACLEINHENFPPRVKKSKKQTKVLWRLPETIDDTPRFGGLEKERLWELFKQEKKNRRKSKKDDDMTEGTDNPELERSVSNVSSNLEESKLPKETGNPQEIDPLDRPKPNEPQPPTAPPPPGFGVSRLSLNETETQQTPQQAPTSPSRLPQRASISTTPTPTPLPPPPPGLRPPQSPAAHIADPPSPHHSSKQFTATTNNGQQQKPPPPPPGMSTSPMAIPGLFTFGSLRASDIAALPPASLSTVIGKPVAQILIHALTTPGHLPFWLAHYHSRAQKLLLFGTAQALAQTADDRRLQWESLIFSNGSGEGPQSSWDCQGWAVQTIDSSENGSVNSNGTGNGTASSLLLVVLTGRTLQRQELLTYHLTLTLKSTTPSPAAPAPAPTPTQYQICNEILSLSRPNPVG